jgi:hypothetical protein
MPLLRLWTGSAATRKVSLGIAPDAAMLAFDPWRRKTPGFRIAPYGPCAPLRRAKGTGGGRPRHRRRPLLGSPGRGVG